MNDLLEISFKQQNLQEAVSRTSPAPDDTTFPDLFCLLKEAAELNGVNSEQFPEYALCLLLRLVSGHLCGKINIVDYLEPYRSG